MSAEQDLPFFPASPRTEFSSYQQVLEENLRALKTDLRMWPSAPQRTSSLREKRDLWEDQMQNIASHCCFEHITCCPGSEGNYRRNGSI